jgi:2-dehydro-3-deoxygluconokinase
VRWFHTGGIMAGLSAQSAETTLAVIQAAKASGAVVSYDLNYRPSLWKAHGGLARCQEVNRACVEMVDVVIGNEEDFTVCLGLDTQSDSSFRSLDVAAYRAMVLAAADEFPNLQAVGVTLRQVVSASINDWGALGWARATGEFVEATWRPGLEIFDRVGGGDSFASGFCYGLLIEDDLLKAVEYGAANGALAMTTPGDTTSATLAEIVQLAAGGSARVQR